MSELSLSVPVLSVTSGFKGGVQLTKLDDPPLPDPVCEPPPPPPPPPTDEPESPEPARSAKLDPADDPSPNGGAGWFGAAWKLEDAAEPEPELAGADVEGPAPAMSEEE
jgi:hypothetical protein